VDVRRASGPIWNSSGVPAVIFGVYGTNFQHVPDLLRQRWGYPVMLAATLVIEVLLWLRFRRRGWL
jgi:magnesium transporter